LANAPDALDLAVAVERAHDAGDGAKCLSAMNEVRTQMPALALRPDLQLDFAQCQQMTGDCAAGRKTLTSRLSGSYTGDDLDKAVDASSLPACRKEAAAPTTGADFERKRALASGLLSDATDARAAHDTKKCRALIAQINDLTTREKLATIPQLKVFVAGASMSATMCLADSGNPESCAVAKAQFRQQYKTFYPEIVARGIDDAGLDGMFHSSFPSCP
jgi:hypothetical protein